MTGLYAGYVEYPFFFEEHTTEYVWVKGPNPYNLLKRFTKINVNEYTYRESEEANGVKC